MVVFYDPKHKEILSNSMVEGHMVNHHAVVKRFIHLRTHGISDNMQKNFALALCFIGEFLLCLKRRAI